MKKLLIILMLLFFTIPIGSCCPPPICDSATTNPSIPIGTLINASINIKLDDKFYGLFLTNLDNKLPRAARGGVVSECPKCLSGKLGVYEVDEDNKFFLDENTEFLNLPKDSKVTKLFIECEGMVWEGRSSDSFKFDNAKSSVEFKNATSFNNFQNAKYIVEISYQNKKFLLRRR